MRSAAPPVRVLFVMIHMAMGGTERLVFNLVRNLDRSRFAPSIAWLTDEPALAEFEALGVPLHRIPKRGRVDLGAMRDLARLVRRERVDVINAHHFMSFVYAYFASIAGGARLVYTEHSEADVLGASGKWRPIGSLLLRTVAGAIGISPHVSATLIRHFGVPGQRVHTIENGVDVAMFSPDGARRIAQRQLFGFGADDVVFGHVANFRHNKNHMFLLRAFREVRQSMPNAKLVFVGQGFATDPENSQPEVAAAIQQWGLEGSVRMLGYQPNVPDVLRMLDVFCLVSHKEGLPLSLIEAMATGLPVIGTDIEGIRSVVERGVNGLTVTPDDVPALAGALGQLAEDVELRNTMALASRRLAADKYSLGRCVSDTQSLFQSLAGGRSEPVPLRSSTPA